MPNQEKSEEINFKKTRLYELLSLLKPKQRRDVVSIVELPLFKLKKEALLLLNEVIKHINKGEEVLLKSDLIALTGIDTKKFNYVVSDLFKKISRVLYSLNLLEGQEQAKALILADLFFEKDFPINLEYAQRDIKTSLDKEGSRTHDFHYYAMKYHEFYVEKGKDTRVYNEHLDSMKVHLGAFYAENKLRFLCEEINRQKIIKRPSNSSSKDTDESYFIEMVKEKDFFHSVSVECYYLVYQMFATRSEVSYQLACDKINSVNHIFAPRLEQTLLRYLMNQCIFFINKNINKVFYANDYLNHVEELDRKNILLNNNRISPGIFQSIILTGLMAEKKAWVISFIKEKAKKLNSPHKAFVKKVHFAFIDFYLDDIVAAYDKIETITKPPSKAADPFFVIFFYKLTIQIYYTKNRKFDADLDIEAKIDSFRQYLYRQNTIALEKKKMLLNFVSFISRIHALKPSLKKKNKLKQELLDKKSRTAYSDWLETLF